MWEVSKVAETVERKPFKSIHIDTEKGIYLLNGEEVPMVSRIDLEFNNGEWSLLFTRDGASSGSGSTEQSIFSPRAERILWPTGLTYRGGRY